MNKAQLTQFIMSKTDEYKKTPLMRMLIADLEVLAKKYGYEPEETSETPAEEISDVAVNDKETISEMETVEPEKVEETEQNAEPTTDTAETAEPAPETAEKAKPQRERLNANEILMLQTIPQLPEFTAPDSSVLSKALLAKVEELHGVKVATSRALLVSMKKKEYLIIKGKKKGLKQTTIWLGKNGLRFLGFTVTSESA